MKSIGLVLLNLIILFGQQGGADLSPRSIGQDSTPYAVHYNFTGLTGDTAYYIKIRLRAPNSTYYGYTYNPQTGVWLSQTAPWVNHPVVRTNSAGSLSGWVFGRNAYHSPPASDDTIQIVLRMVGTTTNIYPTVKPLINILDMTNQGGWLYGHIYEDPGFLRPFNNHHILAFGGNVILGIYTTEKNGVLEGYDSLNIGYIRMALPAGRIDSLQVRDYNNNRIISYQKTSPPWLIRAGDSTNIDRLNIAEWKKTEQEASKIQLLTNPAKDMVRMVYPLARDYKITVYNPSGQIVCRLANGVTIFKRNNLPSGIYFFEFKRGTIKEVFSILFID